MFKYFNNDTSNDNILLYIKNNNEPCVIVTDINFLSQSTSNDIFKKTLYDQLTLEFYIIDSKPVSEIEDILVLNNMIDIVYNVNIINNLFFKQNSIKIDKINNICSINYNDKNSFLYNLINDDFYNKSFSKPVLFYLIFSSLLDVIDFTSKYNIYENINIILRPQEKYKPIFIESYITVLKTLLN